MYLFCNAQDQAVREKSAEVLCKMSSDKFINMPVFMKCAIRVSRLPEEKILNLLKRFDNGIQQTFKSAQKEVLNLYRKNQEVAASFKFKSLLIRCEKPKLFGGSNREEPCSSPALVGCACHSGATSEGEQY